MYVSRFSAQLIINEAVCTTMTSHKCTRMGKWWFIGLQESLQNAVISTVGSGAPWQLINLTRRFEIELSWLRILSVGKFCFVTET